MKDIPMPERIKELPRDSKGRPIPFFVQKPVDGAEPDFRIIDLAAISYCYNENLCWVCGQKLGIHRAFVLGPMCAINRVNSEPPSHYQCAHYSVQVCPFLSQPRMHRREEGLPDEFLVEPAGFALYHNPGASALWLTKDYYPFSDGRGGFLFRLGAPERVEWYALGEPATRLQVMEAINKGYPTLQKCATMDGPKAERRLEKQYQELMPLLPK